LFASYQSVSWLVNAIVSGALAAAAGSGTSCMENAVSKARMALSQRWAIRALDRDPVLGDNLGPHR